MTRTQSLAAALLILGGTVGLWGCKTPLDLGERDAPRASTPAPSEGDIESNAERAEPGAGVRVAVPSRPPAGKGRVSPVIIPRDGPAPVPNPPPAMRKTTPEPEIKTPATQASCRSAFDRSVALAVAASRDRWLAMQRPWTDADLEQVEASANARRDIAFHHCTASMTEGQARCQARAANPTVWSRCALRN